jgi:hypothetical protein
LDFSLDTPPAPDLRRFQNFQRTKRDTKKSIEPAAAPTITPMIRPRELAIDSFWVGSGVEVFTAVLEDGEVASGDGDEVDDTDVDIDGDEDAEGLLEALVSVGWESVVGAAEGVADPSVGAKTVLSVWVSA